MGTNMRIDRLRSKCIATMGADNFWKAFNFLSEARDKGVNDTMIRRHLIGLVGHDVYARSCFDVDQLVVMMQISKDRAAPNSAGQQVSSPIRHYKADRDHNSSLPYASSSSHNNSGLTNISSLNSSNNHTHITSLNSSANYQKQNSFESDKSGYPRESPPTISHSISPDRIIGRPPGRRGTRVTFWFLVSNFINLFFTFGIIVFFFFDESSFIRFSIFVLNFRFGIVIKK